MFYELLTLFFSSFISATLFPGGSELLLIYYLNKNPAELWWYFSVVTAGNSLGAIVSYLLGYHLNWGIKEAQSKYKKAWLLCQRHGAAALLFSWLPVVGDFLPLAAGWLKSAVIPSLLLITIGKAMRYWVVISSTLYLL